MITVLHFIVDILNYASAHSLHSAMLTHTEREREWECTMQCEARERNNINLLHERSVWRLDGIRRDGCATGARFYSRYFSIAHSLFRFTLSFCFAVLFAHSIHFLPPRCGCVFGWDVCDSFLIRASHQCTHIIVAWIAGKSRDLTRKTECATKGERGREIIRERVWMTELCTVTPTNGN